jgi:DNA (cytosine-5)-methyltransferase 1
MLRDSDQFTWPSALPDEHRVTAWDSIGSIEITQPPQARGEWADLLPSIPEGNNYQWHTDHGGGLPLFGYRTKYWSFLLKLAKNRPSWTIPASAGPATGPFHWNNRPLDVSEMAALQTFPSDWHFAGSQRSAAKQVGNATPPLLSEVVGRCLRAALGSRLSAEGFVHAVERSDSIPQPEPTFSVPDKYLHLVGEHPDHPGEGLGPAPRRITA